MLAQEFWSLGFDDMFCISAITGSGTGELMDEIAKMVPDEVLTMPDVPKFAIIGQPNVGKSSLINVFWEMKDTW